MTSASRNLGDFTFAGARALVIGATGALGSLIASELNRRGADLALSGRDELRLRDIARTLKAVTVLPADLSEPTEAARVVDTARAALGGLDVLVNAAGVVAFGSAHDMHVETAGELLAVNLEAPIIATRTALGVMDDGGAIVNISGIVAEMPTAGMAAYSASKAGLRAFSTAAAREARRRGLRVIDARPPHLDTGMELRAIAGEPPALSDGADAAEAAVRIVEAIADPRAREVLWAAGAPAAA